MHPTRTEWQGQVRESPRHHEISLMCDDVEATRAELEAKGATFSSPIVDRGFGLTTMLDVPGADPILLYEPRTRPRTSSDRRPCYQAPAISRR